MHCQITLWKVVANILSQSIISTITSLSNGQFFEGPPKSEMIALSAITTNLKKKTDYQNIKNQSSLARSGWIKAL